MTHASSTPVHRAAHRLPGKLREEEIVQIIIVEEGNAKLKCSRGNAGFGNTAERPQGAHCDVPADIRACKRAACSSTPPTQSWPELDTRQATIRMLALLWAMVALMLPMTDAATGTGAPIAFINYERIVTQRNFGQGFMKVDYFAAPERLNSLGTSNTTKDHILATLNFQTEAFIPNHFNVQPGVDPKGTLSFEPAYGFYGNTSVGCQIRMGNGAFSDWVNFTIEVEYVNHKPSFGMSPVLQLFEDSRIVSMTRFAFNISKGFFAEASELGIYHTQSPFRSNEDWQKLSFSVIRVDGRHDLFDVHPFLAPNGTLTFTPTANANGNATYSVFLRDSGGSDNISQILNFSVVVVPVNDAPSFNMQSQYSVLETIEDTVFSFPNAAIFGTWGSRFQGPLNEADQNATFEFRYVDGNSTLFIKEPQINAAGILAFSIGAYRWGNTTFNVTLYDNGGTSFGGVDRLCLPFTIHVTAVNTNPSLGLPDEIWLWVSHRATARALNMMVRDMCCSPCPGPAQSWHACYSGQCCTTMSDDGRRIVIPSQANVSAGPWEQMQTLSFTVSVDNPLLFSGKEFPQIHFDGSIDFGIGMSRTGTAVMKIMLQDSDGGRTQQYVRITVLVGYIEVELNMSNRNLLNSTQIRQIAATAAGVDISRVMIGDSNGSVALPQRRLLSDYVRIQIIGDSITELVQRGQQLRSQNIVSLVDQPQILARNGNGEEKISFDLAMARVIPASTLNIIPITNISVDQTRLSPMGVEEIFVSVRILGYITPSIHSDWIAGDEGAVCNSSNAQCVASYGFSGCRPCLFASAPTVQTQCQPFCRNASLILDNTFVNGEAIIEVTVHQSVPWTYNVSRTIRVNISLTEDSPRVQHRYLQRLVLSEDGGPCSVPDCKVTPVVLRLTEVFFDADMWLPGRDMLSVVSSNPAALNCSVNPNNGTLILIPGRHKHGFFNVTAFDSTGRRTDPPLSVWVKHVNHAPYLVAQSSFRLKLNYSEDEDQQSLDLLSYISDVDIEDQGDSSAEVDLLHFKVQSDDPTLIQAKVDRYQLWITFTKNRHGFVRLFVNATDMAGESATTVIEIHIASKLDAPFAQRELSQNVWHVTTGVFCNDGQVPVGSLVSLADRYSVTLQQCQEACVADSKCVAITYQTIGDRCRKAIKRCKMQQIGDHSNVYVRPTGLVLPEGGTSQLNLSTLFGDVDNCATLQYVIPCSNDGDMINISALSSDESRVQVRMNDTMLIVQTNGNMHTCNSTIFWECSDRFANIPIRVTLTATDLSNLNTSVTFDVTVLAVNDVPAAILPTIHLTEGAVTNTITRIHVKHTSISTSNESGWEFVDPDVSTNPGGDSIRFAVQSSDISLFSADLITATTGDHVSNGSNCQFPFTLTGIQYNNCTNSIIGEPSSCQTSDGTLGACKHVIQISLKAGQFGRASVKVVAEDSYGGRLETSTDVFVHMINEAPYFLLPPALSTFQNVYQSQLQLLTVYQSAVLTPEKYTGFVKVISLGTPQCPPSYTNDGTLCCFEIDSDLNFSSRCPRATRSEDICQRPPVREIGDCWGLGAKGQDITFKLEISNGDPSMFSVLPEVSFTGDLLFELRPERSGEVKLNITLMDNGGSKYNGVSSSSRSVTIRVIRVFDEAFSIQDKLIIPENVNTESISAYYPNLQPAWAPTRGTWYQHGFVTNISQVGYSTPFQQLTFIVTKVSGDDDLFVSIPRIEQHGNEGTLVFSQMPDRHGVATFQVTLENNTRYTLPEFRLLGQNFTIMVEQVNNAPVFCVLSPLTILEDTTYDNITFLKVSSGGSKCLGDTDSCGACGRYDPVRDELNQKLSFEVRTAGPSCSPFECLDNEFDLTFDSVSWMKIDEFGRLFVRACNSGQVNVTITVRDDGGTFHGGVDFSVQTVLVIVQDLNDKPHFDFSVSNEIYLLEGSRDPFQLAINVTAGRCEIQQTVSFQLKPLLFCVPDCNQTNLSLAPQDGSFFTQDSIKLFESFELSTNGTFRYALHPYRNGRVVISIGLSDGNMIAYHNLTVNVLKVNNPPEIEFTASDQYNNELRDLLGLPDILPRLVALVVPADTQEDEKEGARRNLFENTFRNIRPGGWNEDDQDMRFVFKMVSGSLLMTCVEAMCKNVMHLPGWSADCISRVAYSMDADSLPGPKAVVYEGPLQNCRAGSSADVRTWRGARRFGKQLFEVTLEDKDAEEPKLLSYGRLSAPMPANSTKFYMMVVREQNNQPTFKIPNKLTVWQDSGCIQTEWSVGVGANCKRQAAGLHIRGGFATRNMDHQIGNPHGTGTAEICKENPSACNSQSVTFTVTPQDEASASFLFEKLPEVSWDGTLSFKLKKYKFGKEAFKIWLKDLVSVDGTYRKIDSMVGWYFVEFIIEVLDVNNAPTCHIPERIVSFGNSSFEHVVAINVSAGPEEDKQEVSFSVIVDDPGLFVELPSMRRDGNKAILKFIAKENNGLTAAVTLANITILDSGGTQAGGKNASKMSSRIEIFPIPKAPVVTSMEDIFLFEGTERHRVRLSELMTSLNSDSEKEEGLITSLSSLNLDYTFAFASNPNLFGVLPRMESSGLLTFQICRGCSGVSSICFTAKSQGKLLSAASFPECELCEGFLQGMQTCCRAPIVSAGKIESERFCSTVHVEPVDHAPVFRFSWNVNCRNNSECSCLDAVSVDAKTQYEKNQACQPIRSSEIPTVRVPEDAGEFHIPYFASGVSPANGYVPASEMVFSGNTDSGAVFFSGTQPEPVLSVPGTEMAADYNMTLDGFVLMAEAQYNAVSMWSLNATSDIGSRELSFVDRRTSGEDRLRFHDQAGSLESMVSVCGLQKWDIGGQRLVVSASGCQHIGENSDFAYNDTYLHDPQWDNVVGHWDFDAASLYNTKTLGKMHVNRFNQDLPNGITQSVTCNGTFCTFMRDKLGGNCLEMYEPKIGPATFRDKSNTLGAAVLKGNDVYCQFDSDWDVPQEIALSAMNFIASADGIEALSIDGNVLKGLFLTDDIDELVNGDPVTSLLPLEAMSFEAVFATGEYSDRAHPLFSTLQRRQCSNPNVPKDCGCNKGWEVSWRFSNSGVSKEGNAPILIALSIAVSQNAKDPNGFSAFDPMNIQDGTLKMGVGPGLGVMKTITWQSPANFVSMGHWLHLIVTYDGKYASIYVNGTLQLKEDVCPKLGENLCGNIIYAASYHTCPNYCPCPPLPGGKPGETVPPGTPCGSNTVYKGCSQGQDALPGRKSAVTIGMQSDINNPAKVVFLHMGLLKHVRLYNKAVSPAYVKSRRAEFDMLYGKYPFNWKNHWYKSNGQSDPIEPGCDRKPPQMSPNVTYVNLDTEPTATKIKILGRFNPSWKYRARFTVLRDIKKTWEAAAKFYETPCVVVREVRQESTEVADSVLCDIPVKWPYGYASAVLSVMQQKIKQIAIEGGNMGDDLPSIPGTQEEYEYDFVWSRACYSQQCGYEFLDSARKQFEGYWVVRSYATPQVVDCVVAWQSQGTALLSNAISGTVARINLRTQSTVMQFDEADEQLKLRYPLTYQRTGSAAPLGTSSLVSYGILDSLEHPFTSVAQLTVLGVSSISIMNSSGELYLLVANFWDGASLATYSNVLRIDNFESGNATLVQGFETNGARKFHGFQISGQTYVAVVTFGENSSIFKWQAGIPISTMTIVDEGVGYINGMVKLKCKRPGPICNRADAFSADFRVDGPADGRTVGKIVDVTNYTSKPEDKFLADLDVVLMYPPPLANKIMDQTITTVRFVEPQNIFCSRLVQGFSLRNSYTFSGCVSGDLFKYSNSVLNGFNANLTSLTGNNLHITVDSPGLFEGDLDVPLVTAVNENCKCKNGEGKEALWSSCLVAEPYATYPKFKVIGLAGAGGRGFEASFELTRNGKVQGLQIRDHGEQYSKDPEIVVMAEMRFNSTKVSDFSSGGCSCGAENTRTPGKWDACIQISRAHGTYSCMGGENHGMPCKGVLLEDRTATCQGSQPGLCKPGKKARIYPNTHVLPTRPGPNFIKYVEQDPEWTGDPGLSQIVPIDLHSRVDLPIVGGTDIVSFTEDGVVYLAMSVYLDVSNQMLSTSSVVFKLRKVGLRLKAELYQTIDTYGATAVNTWTMPWCEALCLPGPGRNPICTPRCIDTRFVMFACEKSSPLYRWNHQSKSFLHVQEVPTTRAVSLEPFQNDDVFYVLVSQNGPISTMYRWNGTMLLGRVDQSTRLSDTAGGQDVNTHSAHAALHLPVSTKTGLLLLAKNSGNEPSLLYKARVEYVRNLSAPTRIVSRKGEFEGADGQLDYFYHYYVLCSGSGAIQVLQRKSNDLYFKSNFSVVGTDGFLEGLSDIAIFGQYLYSVSSISNGGTINVFVIDTNGNLKEREDLRVSASNTMYGLRGVRTLYVNSQYIFTASFVDQALSVFRRTDSGVQEGRLHYVDHIRNGERIVPSFAQYEDGNQYDEDIPFNSTANFFLDGKLPARAGRKPTGHTVACVSYGLVRERHLFAVAYVPDIIQINCTDVRCPNSSTLNERPEVFIYEYVSDHFAEVQVLDRMTNVTDLEFFQRTESDGARSDFLVIVTAVGKPSLYTYDPDEAKFIFFNVLTFMLPDSSYLPPECVYRGTCSSTAAFNVPGIENPLPAWNENDRSISGRKAKAFFIGDVHYMAVAYWWPFVDGHGWFSIVYRWKEYGSTMLENGKVAKGLGFGIFQVITTEGALDVDTATWKYSCSETPEGVCDMHILIIANFGDRDHDSSCKIYQYKQVPNDLTQDLGMFIEIQSLHDGVGISGVIAFSMHGDHYVALAAHGKDTRVSFPWTTDDDISQFKYGNALYKWDNGNQSYLFDANLDDLYSVSLFDKTYVRRVHATIGASDFEFFEWNGDQYLIIAQGLCNIPDITGQYSNCLPRAQQPRSAVLQWNPVDKKFGELLSLSNATSVALRQQLVRDAEATHRSQALRLISAGAVRAKAANVGNKMIIVMTTKLSGAVFYDFSFKQVTGLAGPRSLLASEGEKSTVYLTSPQEYSLVVVTLFQTIDTSLDGIGNLIGGLIFNRAFSDMNRESAVSAFDQSNTIGLAGSLQLKFRDRMIFGSFFDPIANQKVDRKIVTDLVISSGVPIDEVPCNKNPIMDLGGATFTFAGGSSFRCQELTFVVSNLTTNNPNLFASPPKIFSNGTLRFKAAKDEYGQATFSVQLKDDGMYSVWEMFADPLNYPPGEPHDWNILGKLSSGEDTSNPLDFSIEVFPINDPPAFLPVKISLTQNSGVYHSVTFATNVTSGAENEVSQGLQLFYAWSFVKIASDLGCEERKQQMAFTRFIFEDINAVLMECFKLCDQTQGCVYVTFTSNYYPCFLSEKCKYVTLLDSMIYTSPRLNFEPQPVLSVKSDLNTGERVGVAEFGLLPRARGVMQMVVFLNDTGGNDAAIGSVSLSSQYVVEFDVAPRNVPPEFTLPKNIAVQASSGTHSLPNFVSRINSGIGECFCGDLGSCLPTERSLCESVSFELFAVETIEGPRPNSTDLFQNFKVYGSKSASLRNLTFTLTDSWSGRFMVYILGKDDNEEVRGKDLIGGTSGRALSFELEIVSVNEIPSFKRLEKLRVTEQMQGQISQRHAYFTDINSGTKDITLNGLFEVSFDVLEQYCSNPSYPEFTCGDLFDVYPSIDNKGFVSFVLKPLIFGLVHVAVLPKNSGPEPSTGFQPVEMVIDVIDVNTPPTCAYSYQHLILFENLGYSSLHKFSLNISTGPESERWQHVVYDIKMIDAPGLFSSLPVIDAEGTFSFETAPDRFGDALITVTCRDNGGVLFGGNDTDTAQQVSLKVLPIPRIFSVTPGIYNLIGNSTFTVKGQHFGSLASRGYTAKLYSYIDIFVGEMPCGRTKYVSDGEIICEALPAGNNGVQDITVIVSDPWTSWGDGSSGLIQNNATREGRLRRAIAYPSFFVAGLGFVGVGSRYSGKLETTPPLMNDTVESENGDNMTNMANFTANMTNFKDTSLVNNDLRLMNASNSTLPEISRHRFVRQLRSWLNCSRQPRFLPFNVSASRILALGLNFSEIRLFCDKSEIGVMNVLDLCHTISILSASAMELSVENVTYLGLRRKCPSTANKEVSFVRAPAKVDVLATEFQGAIRTLAFVDGELFVGGRFVGSDSNSVSHVGRWANVQKHGGGTYFLPCGNGLDGAVNVIERYKGAVVTGGTFSFAALDGGTVPHIGGLVAWDLASQNWILVGRTPVLGTVTAIMSTSDGLYIGGRFRLVGGQEVNNIALHVGALSEPGGWKAMNSGVQGGYVSAMTQLGHELYVGGTFMQAGRKRVHYIARWDGSEWQQLADEECQRQCIHSVDQNQCQEQSCELGGPVTALASTGAVLFAAGVFDVAGGRPVRNLARFFGGAWGPVLGGIEGSIIVLKIFSLTPSSSIFENSIQDLECLYVAGDLSRIFTQDGASHVAPNLVRLCPGNDWNWKSGLNVSRAHDVDNLTNIKWEAVEGTNGLGPVLALHVADQV